MAGYIGSKASVVSSGAERKKTFAITGSTTSLTGLNYTVGKVHVFQNGVRLVDGTDYTATNGTTITLTVAAQSGDNVVVISQASYQVADAVLTSGDSMTGDLSLGDNNKVIFGAGSDLQIYHSGSHSVIKDAGDGNLQLIANDFQLRNGADNANMMTGANGGAITLMHNGSSKLATTATGIDITGTVTLGANNANSPQILFENSDGVTGDAALSTYDDSSGTMLVMGSNFYINSSGSETRFNTSEESSAVMLNRNGDLNLMTGGTGATATTRLKIDSSGNVGIGGTPDSGRKLHIEGGDATVGITLKDTAGGQFGINSDGGSLIFKSDTANSERMLILSSGAKNFGTFKSENGGFNIYAGAADSGSFAARFDGTGTGASNVVQITNGYGEVGSIKIASNGTTTNYNTSSDYRLKTDVQPVTDASARIQSLNPVNFEWIRSGTRTDGFLAHEAQAVVPDCVSGAHNEVKVWEDDEELPDGVSVGDNKLDDDGNTIPVYQGIDQSKLVPLLTAALQEALTEIASLKTRVEALEA